MSKIAIAVHGGADRINQFLRDNIQPSEDGMKMALERGYAVLKKGGSSLDAVEEAVKELEDNPYFNAGRGSALNCAGEVEMDASIMDGKKLMAGAVSMVRSVKNPITLARQVMTKTRHVFLSGYGALELARNCNIALEPDSYFITDHQNQELLRLSKHENMQKIMKKRLLGTVGAVALDKEGNLAAATSTGGTSNCLPGRIGDSCVIGAGCYANNATCAMSGTGDGEVLITNVIGHTIAMMMELKGMSIQEACDHVIHDRNIETQGDIGVISVDRNGDFGICFNSQAMRRGWIDTEGKMHLKIFGQCE